MKKITAKHPAVQQAADILTKAVRWLRIVGAPDPYTTGGRYTAAYIACKVIDKEISTPLILPGNIAALLRDLPDRPVVVRRLVQLINTGAFKP